MQKQHREAEVAQEGTISFRKIEPPALSTIPVLIQALDNQWLTPVLLQKTIMRGRLSQRDAHFLKGMVRNEYVRALINQRQVIVNRAYLYNNLCVTQDYIRRGRNREAFKALLDEGTLVSYLYTESSPIEHPPFEIDVKGFTAWQQICQEVNVYCLRLSWDDSANRNMAYAQLGRRFLNFAQSLVSGDYDQYVHDLRLDSSAKKELKERFLILAHWCLEALEQNKPITRNALYKTFVIAGKDATERRYDRTKPFAGELKQLFDLAYNSYLADALGGYLLTPADSLLRTVLQEWEQLAHLSTITGDELVQMIRDVDLTVLPEGLYLTAFNLLTLSDVQAIRNTDEWNLYMTNLESLLNHPLQFASRITTVYQSYTTLLEKMIAPLLQQHPSRRDTFVQILQPVVELVVDLAGATLSIFWTSFGPRYRFAGRISEVVRSTAVPVVVRFILRGQGVANQLSGGVTSAFDFMRCKMFSVHEQWADVQRHVHNLPGFREWGLSSESNSPTINYQDQGE